MEICINWFVLSVSPLNPWLANPTSPEATCYLAHIFHDYEVLPLFEGGEILEGWKERVLLKTECMFIL
jgi:hypothetical protein